MPTALVTGASTGIGRATVLRLAAAGWSVLAGVRDSAAGGELAAQAGAGLNPISLDVTDEAQIAAAAELVAAQTQPTTAGSPGPGRLDALVNNAGIGLGGPLELVSAEEWRTQFEVNVFGQAAVTRALLPALRAASGRIVFVSSVGGRVSVPFNGPYAASKHALEAIGDALRGELHSSRIKVSLVEPGGVKTPIWDKARALAGQFTVPPELEREYARVPAALTKLMNDSERRGVSPERVAATIERALTARRPRARYVVGGEAHGMIAAHALLPTAAFDRLLRRVMNV
ncbi:MAG TPA: SDR family oxidoreductase [Solirubrobacteraceae bacterium]|nr:SDR family oxidoreductase [Solirubrobacteraceae bacterium]